MRGYLYVLRIQLLVGWGRDNNNNVDNYSKYHAFNIIFNFHLKRGIIIITIIIIIIIIMIRIIIIIIIK